MSVSLGPKLVEVPDHLAIATEPKLIDFTDINMYPSKYKIINGKIYIRSLVLEDVDRQHEALKEKNTTVMIGDCIKVDFKFGHFEDNKWHDYYVNGIYRVKELIPKKHHSGIFEIVMLVTEVKQIKW